MLINNLQGITNAGLGERRREEYEAIVLSSRPVFVSISEFLGNIEGIFKMIRMIFGKLHRNKWHTDWYSKKLELDINFALSIHLATIFFERW